MVSAFAVDCSRILWEKGMQAAARRPAFTNARSLRRLGNAPPLLLAPAGQQPPARPRNVGCTQGPDLIVHLYRGANMCS
jgi:hypothetical protein